MGEHRNVEEDYNFQTQYLSQLVHDFSTYQRTQLKFLGNFPQYVSDSEPRVTCSNEMKHNSQFLVFQESIHPNGYILHTRLNFVLPRGEHVLGGVEAGLELLPLAELLVLGQVPQGAVDLAHLE